MDSGGRKFYRMRASSVPQWDGHRAFEHWYRSNQVYFITARCRDKFPAFDSKEARLIFWDRFNHWTTHHEFFPWVVSLMSNHYHAVGYCKRGESFGQMMRKIHGSTAKLVNDLLPDRHLPFWTEAGHQDYFDGCLRDEKQCRRASHYVLTQSVRHGICRDWRDYPDTKVYMDLDKALARASELRAFLYGVPYARYIKGKGKRKDRS